MKNKTYNIAFSFEGKYRTKITVIKKQLEEKYNVKIFLDQHESGELQSENPLAKLYDVFKNDTEYVVLFISKAYKNKISKNIDCSQGSSSECYLKKEIEAIQHRIESEGRGFLKIVKIDKNISFKNELKISDDAYDNFDDGLVNCIVEDFILSKKKIHINIDFYERIFHLFRLHDINEEEIPLLLNEWFDVSFYDVLTNKESFHRKVKKEMIDFLSLNFGVNKQWLYGNSINLYNDENGFYKNVKNFGDYIGERKHQIEKLYILTESIPNKKKDEKGDSNYIVLVAKYLQFDYPENDKPIYSYEIFNEDCRWGYQKCRYNFKSFLLYLHKHHHISLTFYHGFAVPDITQKINKFNRGEMDFDELIGNRRIWHPEDYIFTNNQSVQAKETDEIDEILNAIKKDQWSWF